MLNPLRKIRTAARTRNNFLRGYTQKFDQRSLLRARIKKIIILIGKYADFLINAKICRFWCCAFQKYISTDNIIFKSDYQNRNFKKLSKLQNTSTKNLQIL
jgi:hypothetical protein